MTSGGRGDRIALTITGMVCDACVGAVTRALTRQAGVAGVSINLARGRAVIDGAASAQTLIAAIEAAGFGAAPAGAH